MKGVANFIRPGKENSGEREENLQQLQLVGHGKEESRFLRELGFLPSWRLGKEEWAGRVSGQEGGEGEGT